MPSEHTKCIELQQPRNPTQTTLEQSGHSLSPLVATNLAILPQGLTRRHRSLDRSACQAKWVRLASMPSVQTGRRAQINSNRSVRDHNQKRPCKTNMTRRYRRYHLLHLLRAEVHGWETSSDHMCISRVCSSLLVCINQ